LEQFPFFIVDSASPLDWIGFDDADDVELIGLMDKFELMLTPQ
jgi:hypothetical protein